jgi:Galactose oxidase, central domain
LKRCLHEMIWDEEAERMLLFGGCSSGFGPCPQGDLWAFDPSASGWAQLNPEAGPTARSNPAMGYDPVAKSALLVGGLTDGGYAADLWSGQLSGEDFVWTPVTANGDGPSPRVMTTS